jgi:2-polyprenyl-3-methyl-5-hydroxy-6-metoxy-1,4-benzoquinol methylase
MKTRSDSGGEPRSTEGPADVPSLAAQADYWRQWNLATREGDIHPRMLRQAEIVTAWIEAMKRSRLRILDVGCGSGWLCERLVRFGDVTGLDLSSEMLERAQGKVPAARFVAGSITEIDLPGSTFDVIVSLEVLAHVDDQSTFFSRCARLLKPGGQLMLGTQNRPIYERIEDIAPPSPNQIRKWVDARQLRRLSAVEFEVQELFSIVPRGYGGYLRFINSVKLNRALSALISSSRLERLKERLGFGCTLMLRAEKKRA